MSSNPYVPGGRGVAAARGWDWIVQGWDIFRRQPWMWVGLTVVGMITFWVLRYVPFGFLVLMLLGPVFGGGVMLGCRTLHEGGKLEFGHLFAGFGGKFGALAAVGAIYFAAQIAVTFVASLITGVGMLAILSGAVPDDPAAAIAMLLAALTAMAFMLPVAMAIWFAPSLIMLQERPTVEAMKESFSGCLKNVVPFLLYGVVLFLAAIVASIPLLLGWLVLMPVIAGSIYTSYRDIYFTS